MIMHSLCKNFKPNIYFATKTIINNFNPFSRFKSITESCILPTQVFISKDILRFLDVHDDKNVVYIPNIKCVIFRRSLLGFDTLKIRKDENVWWTKH